MNESMKKYIGIAILGAVVAGAYFILNKKEAMAPTEDPVAVETQDITDSVTEKPEISQEPSNLTPAQEDLLARLKKSVDDRNFETFPDLLLEVYKNQWKNKEFIAQESALYVFATNEYWVKGNLSKTLEVSTKVYNKVPEAWRFRYLRVLALEKYGRNAFNAGDLVGAENYAMQILRMMFRPEGANLMGDIYIKKITDNIAGGNIDMAKQNLQYIWDYEVSEDRRATLEGLKSQLDPL